LDYGLKTAHIQQQLICSQRLHLRDPGFQGERRTQEITHVRFKCERALIILITETNPIRQHSHKTSLAALYTHDIISQAFTITCHFRNCTKLVNQKGRARWGRVARASIAGRSGGKGQDEVTRSPIQLVEGLHGFPYSLNDRIDCGRREVDAG